MRILCGGPISEDKEVFEAHIESLKAQEDMHYMGIDNSPVPLDPPTGFLSINWIRRPSLGEYKELRVRWTRTKLKLVGELREKIRLAALERNFDYLFMVDADTLLGKDVLKKLLEAEKDIITALIWTARPQRPRHYWPNAWVIGLDQIAYPPPQMLVDKIREGGIRKVEVSGGCYLLSRYALENISYLWQRDTLSEDVSMALTAQKAGIPIYLHCDAIAEHRRRR